MKSHEAGDVRAQTMIARDRCCLVRLGRCVDAHVYNLEIIFTQLLSISILAEALFCVTASSYTVGIMKQLGLFECA